MQIIKRNHDKSQQKHTHKKLDNGVPTALIQHTECINHELIWNSIKQNKRRKKYIKIKEKWINFIEHKKKKKCENTRKILWENLKLMKNKKYEKYLNKK